MKFGCGHVIIRFPNTPCFYLPKGTVGCRVFGFRVLRPRLIQVPDPLFVKWKDALTCVVGDGLSVQGKSVTLKSRQAAFFQHSVSLPGVSRFWV